MSLRRRILLLVGAINVGVALLIVGIGLLSGDRVAASPAAIEEAMDLALDADLDEAVVHAASYAAFVVLLPADTEDFEIFSRADDKERVSRATQILKAGVRGKRVGVENDGEGLAVFFPAGAGVRRAAYIGFHERARRAAEEGLRSVYLTFMAGTLLLILVTYLILSRLVLRPLERLSRASEAMAGGAPPEVLVRSGHGDEMDRLFESFNRMSSEVHEYQQHLEERVMDALQRVTAAERRLLVAQRVTATGTLAAGIAHEINNPLGGISNAVARLQSGSLSPEKQAEYFQLVAEGLDHIRHIVERVLHFAPKRAEPIAVDAGDVCRRAIDLTRHRAERFGIDLKLEVGPATDVLGDGQELREAVINLILNAVDAIGERPEGSEDADGSHGVVRVTATAEGAEVVLSVEDDGPGMDEETCRRCVDPFYSTKEQGKGTGLGLGIVQHIATDHGGALEIESGLGTGTRVRIRLPAAGAGA
ncbi:MAG: HAMP domain-containing sensor histidine kinase [Planctomycetota bacterium]